MNSYFYERNNIQILKLENILKKLPEYCRDYFIGIEYNTTPLTRINYAKDLEIFFSFLKKNKFHKAIVDISVDNLNSLKTRDIELFINYLSYYEFNGKTRTNTEKGKSRKLATLRSFFKYLYNHDILKENIVSKIDTPKLHSKEIIRLEVDEVVKILDEAENQTRLSKKQQSLKNKISVRDFAILSLLLGTGIRVSECVGINLSDLDLENYAFRVTRKGGNQVVLYFSEEVAIALSEWLEKRTILLNGLEEDALFISLQKKRICVRAVENIVKKYAKIAAPLKKISPHKLRSTYGTNLYRETQDIYVVAEVLGHKDVNTTKKHYAAISEDIKRKAADKVKLR